MGLIVTRKEIETRRPTLVVAKYHADPNATGEKTTRIQHLVENGAIELKAAPKNWNPQHSYFIHILDMDKLKAAIASYQAKPGHEVEEAPPAKRTGPVPLPVRPQ